jgi:hypothetical protein
MFRQFAQLSGFVFLGVSLALAGDGWTYGSSDHFEVYTTGGAGRAREALNYFERIHAFYAEVLKVDPKLDGPTRIILFSSEKEFKPYRPSEGAVAYYVEGHPRDHIVLRSLMDSAYPIVVHEYMHLIVKHATKAKVPLWFNEGFAEYYSTLQPKGGKMAVGAPPAGRLYQAKSFKPIAFEKLFAVGHKSPEYTDKAKMGEFYAQSWALVHMLLASDDYFLKSPEFIRRMLTGEDSAAAITSTYGKPITQIYKDFERYLSTGTFQLGLFDYKSPRARRDSVTRAATDFEARLALARLLASANGFEKEARIALTQLEREQEENVELQEAFATYEYDNDTPLAALPHFTRAVELGSKDWMLYRDYAAVTDNAAQRADLLGKAVLYNPEELEIRFRYTDALLRVSRPAQALAALSMVKKIEPANAFTFFQLSTRANAGVKQIEQAQAAAERALQYAATVPQREFAQALIAGLSRPNASELIADTPPQEDGDEDDGNPANRLSLEQIRAIRAAEQLNHSTVVIEARFEALDCSGTEPAMHFLTDSGSLRLSMQNPNTILLKGAKTETVSLSCGDQKSRPVRIGYNPEESGKANAAGDLRYLEFLQ